MGIQIRAAEPLSDTLMTLSTENIVPVVIQIYSVVSGAFFYFWIMKRAPIKHAPDDSVREA